MAATADRTAAGRRSDLSLTELILLGLVAEAPTHGFALARLVGRDGPIGQVFTVARPAVYRAVDRLVAAGLLRARDPQPSTLGPQRTVVRLTPAGRTALDRWLRSPVGHQRDIRTELLAKLALLERAGYDQRPLLAAQRRVLEPIVSALQEQASSATGIEATIARWRYRTAGASLQFIDDLLA